MPGDKGYGDGGQVAGGDSALIWCEQTSEAEDELGIGRYAYDLVTRQFFVSPATRRIVGLEPDTALLTYESVRDILVPTEVGGFLSEYDDVISGNMPRKTVINRVADAAGETKLIESTFRCVFAADGTPLQIRGFTRDISPMVVVATEARTASARLKTAFVHGRIGVWELRYVNGRQQILQGGDLIRDFTGKPILDLGLVDEPYRSKMADTQRAAIDGKLTNFSIEFPLAAHDGARHWLRMTGWRLSDELDPIPHYEGIISDVTAEKEASLALEYVRQSAAIGLMSFDDHGNIVTANRYAEQLYGYEPGELIGQSVAVLGPESERDFVHSSFALFRETRQLSRFDGVPREAVGRKKDGREFPIEIAISATQLNQEDVVIASINDISARKEAEAKFLQAQKLETVGHLTAGVAHDFNNLLTAIQFGTEFARDAVELGENPAEEFDMIIGATQRGADLVRRLSIFSRQDELRPQVVDPGQLVVQALKLIKTALSEKITIETRIADAVPPISVDTGQLENALLNLAFNSRDAMPQGGRLIFGVQAAGDHGSHGGRHVEISVTDSGAGMSREVLANALDPFFTTKEAGKGTGLGLSMVYGFVNQSAGHLEIDSGVGAGTTVRMRFPAVRRSQEGAVGNEVKGTEGVLKLGRVLLVDDDDGVRRGLEMFLRPSCDRLEVAANGADALALIQSADRLDLLVTDVVLPGGTDGFHLADATVAAHKGCKVLLMSGYFSEDGSDRGHAAGYAVLRKPFSTRDLAVRINEVMSATDD